MLLTQNFRIDLVINRKIKTKKAKIGPWESHSIRPVSRNQLQYALRQCYGTINIKRWAGSKPDLKVIRFDLSISLESSEKSELQMDPSELKDPRG